MNAGDYMDLPDEEIDPELQAILEMSRNDKWTQLTSPIYNSTTDPKYSKKTDILLWLKFWFVCIPIHLKIKL